MRSWIALAFAAAASACAAGGPPRVTPAVDPGTTLEARLFPPYYGQVALQLSRPAYVALFELVPGRGVSLLYPQAGTGFVQVRETWVSLRYNPQRWLYTDAASGYAGAYGTGRYAGYDGYGDARRRGAGQAPPRYLFLVASEKPLAVERFQREAGSLRSYLGVSRYAAYEPYEVMEQLLHGLLPFDDGWVTDVFVDWGYDWGYGSGPAMGYASASYHTVVCGDGRVGTGRWVSGWGWTSFPCAANNMPAGGVPTVPGAPVGPGGTPIGGDTVVATPEGEGRERATGGDRDGRRRASAEGAAAEQRAAETPEEARSRQRIAQLREDALRADFRDALSARLRQDVRLRQRSDMIRAAASPDGRPAQNGRAEPRSRSGEPAAGTRRADGPSSTTEPARRRTGETQPGAATRREGSQPSGESGSAGGRSRTPPPSSPPPSSSGSEPSGSSGGRSRTPPPA